MQLRAQEPHRQKRDRDSDHESDRDESKRANIWAYDSKKNKFRQVTTFSFDVALEYSHVAWRGRVRASAGIGGTLPRAAVVRFDGELADMLASSFRDPLAVPHRVWALIAKAP